jgi:hypothetical protein
MRVRAVVLLRARGSGSNRPVPVVPNTVPHSWNCTGQPGFHSDLDHVAIWAVSRRAAGRHVVAYDRHSYTSAITGQHSTRQLTGHWEPTTTFSWWGTSRAAVADHGVPTPAGIRRITGDHATTPAVVVRSSAGHHAPTWIVGQ